MKQAKFIMLALFLAAYFCNCSKEGPQGPAGAQGAQGAQGAPGAKGEPGHKAYPAMRMSSCKISQAGHSQLQRLTRSLSTPEKWTPALF